MFLTYTKLSIRFFDYHYIRQIIYLEYLTAIVFHSKVSEVENKCHNTNCSVIKAQADVHTPTANTPVIFSTSVRKQCMLQNFPIGKICMADLMKKRQSNKAFNYLKNNN